MKKLFLIISLILPVLGFSQKKGTAPKTFDLLIGTYTKATSKGIYVYRFYEETGKLAYLAEADDLTNPSYLCVSDNNKFVYAVNESDKGGGISALKFDPASGKLEQINSQQTGSGPAYIAVDKDQKNVIVSNYSGGSLAVAALNKDGSIGAVTQTIKDEGHSINADRQAAPHVHSSMFSPDEKYLLYADLGTDKINIYSYHASKTPALTPATPSFVEAQPGNGPRHMAFSADGKYLYLVQEMGAVVTAYSFNDGKLKQLQSVSMVPDGYTGKVGAADIHISPDGRFLYASNRGDADEIVQYAISPENGQLTFIERYRTMGKSPRNFVIDPTGNYLLVANQSSDNVSVFKIDKPSGKLSPTRTQINISMPVCLKMVPVE
ncbi:MAG TPA: lactonase family protein [Mucilaginibacter sp.]